MNSSGSDFYWYCKAKIADMYKLGLYVQQDLNLAKQIYENLKKHNDDAVELFYLDYFTIIDKLRISGQSSLFRSNNQIFAKNKNLNKRNKKVLAIGPYKALLIAVQDYSNLDKLFTPINDVRDIDQTLKNKYGFITTRLINPDHKTLFFRDFQNFFKIIKSRR